MKIKYDRFEMKIICVTGIVAVVLFALGLLLLTVGNLGAEVFAILSMYASAFVLLFCMKAFFSGKMYFRRLKKYGYEIPDRKKDYDGLLENLPRREEFTGVSLFSHHSRWGMIASLTFYVVFMLLNLAYLFKWKFMPGDAKGTFVICSVVCLGWLIIALIFFLQSNKKKYRDDVEQDTTRKVRWETGTIVANVVIMIFASSMALYMCNGLMEYFFKSRIAYDREVAYMIGDSVRDSLKAHSDSELADSTSYGELCEGLEITSWGKPADEIQKEIADAMGIDDFTVLCGYMQLADGDARIEVKLAGEAVSVRLLNPYKELAEYDNRYKEIAVVSEPKEK